MDNQILMRLDGEVKELGEKVKELGEKVNVAVDKIDKVHRLLVGEEEAKANAVINRLEKAEEKLSKHDKIHTIAAVAFGIVLFLPTIYGVVVVIEKIVNLITK